VCSSDLFSWAAETEGLLISLDILRPLSGIWILPSSFVQAFGISGLQVVMLYYYLNIGTDERTYQALQPVIS
jgi:hypothetical protein